MWRERLEAAAVGLLLVATAGVVGLVVVLGVRDLGIWLT